MPVDLTDEGKLEAFVNGLEDRIAIAEERISGLLNRVSTLEANQQSGTVTPEAILAALDGHTIDGQVTFYKPSS